MQTSLSIKSVKMSTRIEGTAWDLMGSLHEYWWSGEYAIFVGGKAIYTDAYNTKNGDTQKGNICVWRFENSTRIVRRYLHRDTPVYVQKIVKGSFNV